MPPKPETSADVQADQTMFRDQSAMVAMGTLLSHALHVGLVDKNEIATRAYKIADCLLAARSASQQEGE